MRSVTRSLFSRYNPHIVHTSTHYLSLRDYSLPNVKKPPSEPPKPMAFEPIDMYELHKPFLKKQVIEQVERIKKEEESKLATSMLEVPKTASELAAEQVIREAASIRPTFPSTPWDISISIPQIYDTNTQTYRPKYDQAIIKEQTKKLLKELDTFIHANPPLKDPWAEREAYWSHPYYSFRNKLRFIVPGFTWGVYAFLTYCFLERGYNLFIYHWGLWS
jgi:NADH-ubiquinone oxidoreductase B12 subunit family